MADVGRNNGASERTQATSFADLCKECRRTRGGARPSKSECAACMAAAQQNLMETQPGVYYRLKLG